MSSGTASSILFEMSHLHLLVCLILLMHPQKISMDIFVLVPCYTNDSRRSIAGSHKMTCPHRFAPLSCRIYPFPNVPPEVDECRV